MEDECRLSSVDDIAAAVNEILGKISDECAASYLLAAQLEHYVYLSKCHV